MTSEGAQEVIPNPNDIEELENAHQIQNRYTFWYRTQNSKTSNYNDSIKKIASFQTVEYFWRIYDYLKRPKDLQYAEYHLFKEGVTPTWEDPYNKAGGKWMIRLKKGISSRYWEDIILAIIGEQFDVGPEICGAVLSLRSNEDILSVWNKTADNEEAVNKIREQMRKVLRLPAMISIEYKKHQASLQDKSSYRNPNLVWRASARTNPDGKPYNNNREGGYQKPVWKGRNEESTGYQGRPAWKDSRGGQSNEFHHNRNQTEGEDGAPVRASGWQRGFHSSAEQSQQQSGGNKFPPGSKPPNPVSGTPAVGATASGPSVPPQPPVNAWAKSKPAI